MEKNKKQILLDQIDKIEEVMQALENNFDCENDIPDEISFLGIVKDSLVRMASCK